MDRTQVVSRRVEAALGAEEREKKKNKIEKKVENEIEREIERFHNDFPCIRAQRLISK